MADPTDHLSRIVERKRVEVERRLRGRRPDVVHRALAAAAEPASVRGASAVERLRRGGREAPHVIAEIKLRSPSAGQIRPRVRGELAAIGRSYERAGATAISVLCDGPGFGGSPLDLRRVARAVHVPVLFKEFVVHPLQIELACALGASLVLLLVRVLDDVELRELIAETRRQGLEPVVEAADERELERALATDATIVGVNARDLRSFSVDKAHAEALVARIPEARVAVFMSGVRSREDFARLRASRADAVLIGEGLMRSVDPGAQLRSFLVQGP